MPFQDDDHARLVFTESSFRFQDHTDDDYGLLSRNLSELSHSLQRVAGDGLEQSGDDIRTHERGWEVPSMTWCDLRAGASFRLGLVPVHRGPWGVAGLYLGAFFTGRSASALLHLSGGWNRHRRMVERLAAYLESADTSVLPDRLDWCLLTSPRGGLLLDVWWVRQTEHHGIDVPPLLDEMRVRAKGVPVPSDDLTVALLLFFPAGDLIGQEAEAVVGLLAPSFVFMKELLEVLGQDRIHGQTGLADERRSGLSVGKSVR